MSVFDAKLYADKLPLVNIIPNYCVAINVEAWVLKYLHFVEICQDLFVVQYLERFGIKERVKLY